MLDRLKNIISLLRIYYWNARGIPIHSSCRIGSLRLSQGFEMLPNCDFMSGHVACSRKYPVVIERDCSIGNNVYIESVNTHFNTARRISIGAGSFIGINAVILASVGKKCIVGANTVVTKDIPDNSLVVGNPMIIKRAI